MKKKGGKKRKSSVLQLGGGDEKRGKWSKRARILGVRPHSNGGKVQVFAKIDCVDTKKGKGKGERGFETLGRLVESVGGKRANGGKKT